MDKKLQNKLIKRFPYLYRGYYKDEKSTCMCWGFEVQNGWYNLIWQLSLALESELDSIGCGKWTRRKSLILDKLSKKWNKFVKLPFVRIWYPSPGIEVTQVKEKFGTLRFYVSAATDEMYKYINMAEHLSASTCEKCGSLEGIQRGRSWIYTSCKNCVESPHDYTKEEMREWQKKDLVGFLKFATENNLTLTDLDKDN